MPTKTLTTHPAIQYLSVLFKPTDTLCFTFIHATKKYKSGGAFTENVFLSPRETIVSDGTAVDQLTQLNNNWHIFVSMAPFKPGSQNRTKANILEVRHVFIDADENGDAVLAVVRASVEDCEIPAPTIIVQSSPCRYQVIWNVEGFSVAECEALNRTLAAKFGSDPAATDAARVLRIPGFRNIKEKYGDPKPIAEIVEYNEPPFSGITMRDFKIPMTSAPDNTVYPAADDAAVQQKIDLLEAALNEASVSYRRAVWEGSGGAHKFLLAVCPWRESHEKGGVSDAMVIVQPSGALGFKCLHAHCANRKWVDFRKHLESLAGHKLLFATKVESTPSGEEPSVESSVTEPTETVPTTSSLVVRPKLSPVALYGLAGDIIKKLEPHTEAHPAGLLVELLVSLGNVMGRTAYYQTEDTRHYTNEFMVKVGESSRARKGTGKNRIRAILKEVDFEWVLNCCESGIGSGEVIIYRMRDKRYDDIFNKRTGQFENTLVDPGIVDKRLCVSLGEFQGILAVCSKANSLLPVVLRDGWDGAPLHNTVKTDPAACEEPMLSVMGDTTSADLGTSLSSADKTNGFANRFLWVYVHQTKELPHGGGDMDWVIEGGQLRDAIDFARTRERVFMDELAYKMWERTMYSKLGREIPGVVGAVTSRAQPHVIRLALIYAMLDKSAHIRSEHLKAAEALWQYCEDSAHTIFGDLLSAEQTQIVDFLFTHGSATKSQIMHDCFQRHRKADLIQDDLDFLRARGRVSMKDVNSIPLYTAKR